MLAIDDRTLLNGSEPQRRPGAEYVGPAPSADRVHIAIMLYPRGAGDGRRSGGQFESLEGDSSSGGFEFLRGADLYHVAQILEFALQYGLTVVETSVSRRRVLLTGTVDAISNAFGTSIGVYEYTGGRFRARSGPLHLPAHLTNIVRSVTGI